MQEIKTSGFTAYLEEATVTQEQLYWAS